MSVPVNLPSTPPAQAPARPSNALHTIAEGINKVAGAPAKAVDFLDSGFASLTQSIAAAMPAFPAARLTSLVIGAPHAHVAHPPSGPPPLPPIPLPPIGPIIAGCSVQVLINGLPAARCGDIILNPTCCGLPPLGEVKTGSSNVFIGGARAARVTDISMHCTPVPGGAGVRAAASAARTAVGVAMKAMQVAGMVAQGLLIVGDAIEAAESEDPAMAAALGMNSAMMAAQMAADAAAMALAAAMGKDPCMPPTGTPGAIVMGAPTVLIGGFPMPPMMAIAKGLLKAVKGLKGRARGRKPANNHCCTGGHPIDFVTGANLDEFLDYADYRVPLFRWQRFYDSTRLSASSPMGWGFRHSYQRTLRRTLDGYEYTDETGDAVEFFGAVIGEDGITADGFRLSRIDERRFRLGELWQPEMEFTFDGDGLSGVLSAIQDDKSRLDLTYDQKRRLCAISGADGWAIELAYDGSDHIIELIEVSRTGADERPLANYTYDDAGHLTEWRDAVGASAHYGYDTVHRMVRNGYRNGYSFHYEYDDQGRCVRSFGDDGLYDIRVEYQPLARTTIGRYADGSTSIYRYDEKGTLTEIVDPAGGVERFVTDELGRVQQQIDPLGNVTQWLYDANGGHYARVDPLGHVYAPMHLEPNPPDPLAYELPETPLEWEFGNRLVRSAINPDDTGDAAERSLPEHTSRTLIESYRRYREVHGGKANGRQGWLEERARPARQRDAMGRKLNEIDSAGQNESWRYDAEGRVTEHSDADGSVDRYRYGSWKCLASHVSPLGAETSFAYTPREYLTRITDPLGTISEYLFDHRDQVSEVRYDGQVEERYRYDVAGNLIEKSDADGKVLLSYDIGPGNLDKVRRLASGEEHRFEYDQNGRFIFASTGKSDTSFAYHPNGKLTADLRDGLGVTHQFDEDGLSCTRYLGRFHLTYARDEQGLRIIDPTGSAHRLVIGRGGLIARQLSNRTAELYQYDKSGRCLWKSRHAGFTEPLRTCRYTYSPGGDLQSVDDSSIGLTRYHYDAAHRLRLEESASGQRHEFIHDLAGNLLRQPGLSGVVLASGNRLREANGDVFEYNNRNAITSRQGASGRTVFHYDALDTLIRCEINGETWTAEYDPLCRRTSKTWQGKTTHYYWDDFRLAAESAPDGKIRLYLYVDEASLVPFMFVDYDDIEAAPRSGRRYFIFTNQIGVPILVEDDNARTVWRAHVSPFGKVEVAPDSRIALDLRFPGHWHDPETGLHYNRFRYYSPELGRFLESDPLGTSGGLNVYAYSANPLTEVDLDGLAHGKQRKGKSAGKRKSKPKGKKGAQKRRSTRKAKTQRGGAHGKVKGKRGYESHHIPANSVSDLPRNKGPAIAMEVDDHRQTASWGSSKEAREYREKQRQLIDQGDFKAAQKMDIDDIRSKFGSKYDDAIRQMLIYTNGLGRK